MLIFKNEDSVVVQKSRRDCGTSPVSIVSLREATFYIHFLFRSTRLFSALNQPCRVAETKNDAK